MGKKPPDSTKSDSLGCFVNIRNLRSKSRQPVATTLSPIQLIKFRTRTQLHFSFPYLFLFPHFSLSLYFACLLGFASCSRVHLSRSSLFVPRLRRCLGEASNCCGVRVAKAGLAGSCRRSLPIQAHRVAALAVAVRELLKAVSSIRCRFLARLKR